jgi:guanylate kinase
MTYDGVILYGPPASGKDTVTAELCRLNAAYAHFEKLKVGDGRTGGYRLVTADQLADLRDRGLIIHEAARYGASYAVDSIGLDDLFKGGRVPVIHMGQMAGVDAVRGYGAHWLDVLLWSSKDVAARRLGDRGSSDIEDRLAAWDATLADLEGGGEPRFTLTVRTDAISAVTAAAIIHTAMTVPDRG